MNVVNIRIHQWVITTYTEIVSIYIQYKQENPFESISLDCTVEDYKKMKETYGKLTSLTVYNTNYFHPNSTKKVHIEFGLNKKVADNTICWKYQSRGNPETG